MTTDHEHQSGTDSDSSSGGISGGLLAWVGGSALAILAGLAKHADDFVKPLARNGDDIARVVGRQADDTVVPMFRHTDDFGGNVASQTDDVIPIVGEDVPDRALLRASIDGLEHLARSQDRGKANPTPPEQDTKGGIEVQLTVRDQKETHRRREDGFFYIAETYSVSNMETTGDGGDDSTEEEIDTELPDETRGEFERLRLKMDGDSVLLLEESHFEGDNYSLDFSVEAEVEFTAGTWEDFEAGRQISVRYSERGRQVMEGKYQKQFQLQWQQIAVRQFGPEATATAEILEIPNTTLLINGSEIHTTTEGPMRIRCHIVP